ncbi:MAG: UDP-N-acetylmuramoyl-L-alanyl-D-glutamate--2,6-diaminopimelate ligase [Phycisphaerae bacterium]|nr:UDP-N-acetylmuramoyl-L-alanyl-D-glutamate--2,6-diaminopimelate ligase [Phycisphaerae bacterium]
MQTPDWTLHRLFAEAGLGVTDPQTVPDVPIHGLTDDSRRVSPGFCFVAIRGTRHDGHDFVDTAIENGASVILAEQPVNAPDSVVTVRSSNTRSAVARLAAAFYGVNRCRNGQRLRLIGITGTNGKSTTCRILQSILQTAGHRTAAVGTLGYDVVDDCLPAQLTTPPPIELCACLSQALEAGAAYAVLEVSSHALDQHRCDGLSFDAAVFTNLTGDHFDYHKTREAYLQAKKRLFDNLDPDAAAVINDDDPASAEMVADCRVPVIRYGISNPQLEVTAEIHSMSLSGCELELNFGGHSGLVRSSLIGRHNTSNILAAVGAAYKLGVRADDIARGIERLGVVRGRLQRLEPEGFPISVLVDYAHTDDALDNALSTLKPLTIGRLICVFGCGGDRDRTKRPRMGAAVGRLAEVAVVTSDNPRTEAPQAIIDEILPGIGEFPNCETYVEPDRGSAIRQAIAMAEAGDTVLIAGKGHEDYQILGRRTIHFDDAEVAREALQEVDLSGPRLRGVSSV